MFEAITRVRLANGLLVMLKEIHTAPIISQWIWYRVGSRDETTGISGISHWVEHMQFKGTRQFSSGELDRAISREGGHWNAMTYIDWTTFYETMPAPKIDLALQLEADRMVNSLFEPKDVEAERKVIISERQGNENEPIFLLNEKMQSASFRVHSYRNDTIGSYADINSMQREQLYQHYRNYYVPNNAVLSLAGDFETEPMLERIRTLYEFIPNGPEPPRTLSVEPPLRNEQRVTVEGPGETTYIQFSFRIPAAAHPDFMPLMVLDSLLCGPSSLNMFGGGISNKTSRLYKSLVEGELAIGVYGGVQATIDPFLYTILLTLHPQPKPAAAIQAVEDEMRRIQETPPAASELSRAVKQARALFAYGSESISNQAFWLGYAEMFADYNWFLTYLSQLEAITPRDVQRVAQQYLQPQNRVLGTYLPNGEANDA